jgi:hypothetical protein
MVREIARDNWWEINLGMKSFQNLLCHCQRATFFVTTKQNKMMKVNFLQSLAGFTFNYRRRSRRRRRHSNFRVFSFNWILTRLISIISSVSLECVSFSKVLNIFSKFISPIKKTFLTEDVSRLFFVFHIFPLFFLTFDSAKKRQKFVLSNEQQSERERENHNFIMIRLKDVMKFFSFSNMCHDFLVSVFLFLIHVKNSFSSLRVQYNQQALI